MAPIRRTMTNHGLPGWYAWVIVIVMTILLSGGAMVLSIRSSERSLQAERQARIEAQHQATLEAERSRVALCRIISLQGDAYKKIPPATPAGRNAAAAWEYAREIYKCE